MKIRVVMLVAVMLIGPSVRATALTAGELLAQCEQLERGWVTQGNNIQLRPGVGIDQITVGKCWGYLHAYFDMAYMNIVDAENPNAPPTRPLGACPPSGVSFTQFIRMFLQKARNTPAELHNPAFFMLANLLTENFPCPR